MVNKQVNNIHENSFKASSSADSMVPTSSKQKGLRILHVDDDLNQLMFTKLFLEEYDPKISVQSISDPLEVIKVLKMKDFDCVVSDYQMSDLDGIALTQRLRESSDIPIIIYTGQGSEEIEEVARAAGADGYVKKEENPHHYVGLCRQIRQAVDGKMPIFKK